jgi:hypothetical protein
MELTEFPNISQHKYLYNCEICNIKTNNKKDYTNHLLTAKHKKREELTNVNINLTHISQNSQHHTCVNCNKIYKSRVGLWSHKKKCTQEEEKEEDDEDDIKSNINLIMEILKQNQTIISENQEFKGMIIDKHATDDKDSLIIELLKQNQEFKELMVEQNKYMIELAKNAGTNNNSHNTTNNKFNMQIFLNETCKDAMSITEFVNSLVLTFKDLEDLGRYGYTQGITNIFTRGLQETEISKRPIHCCDLKRLIMYIKDTNGWEKENSTQENVILLIKKIAAKNLKQATEWMKINNTMIHGPDSSEQRQYLKMITQLFGGTPEENMKSYNKIIRNIAPQCYIDKYPALN